MAHTPLFKLARSDSRGGSIRSYHKTYNESGLEQSRLWPAGTLCITIAANIAETGILTFPACFPDSIVGFIPSCENIKAEFYEHFIRSQKAKIERYAPATAQRNINLDILGSIAVPVPPADEQTYLVAEVERRLSILDNMGITVAAELKRAEATRQSILHRAFTGQLVPQDPTDEPASVLLERIQAEKVKAGAQAIRDGAGRRGRPRKNTNQPALLETP
ncbi:restriction endonuclease subunit S [Deinococcus koreensis]|uniref:restriction endonuclease subunit S n=1 Tax=Deinococcus koreensis TaxID=2054903 RepID=UPI0010571A13|nr:restriction endonuclease subunit S [Deinococcus koreensis]